MNKERPLTPRQLTVLRLYACGVGYRVIAALLGLSSKTVGVHLLEIEHRTHAYGCANLTRYAVDHNILPGLSRT